MFERYTYASDNNWVNHRNKDEWKKGVKKFLVVLTKDQDSHDPAYAAPCTGATLSNETSLWTCKVSGRLWVLVVQVCEDLWGQVGVDEEIAVVVWMLVGVKTASVGSFLQVSEFHTTPHSMNLSFAVHSIPARCIKCEVRLFMVRMIQFCLRLCFYALDFSSFPILHN